MLGERVTVAPVKSYVKQPMRWVVGYFELLIFKATRK
jgi:hypothetical protein